MLEGMNEMSKKKKMKPKEKRSANELKGKLENLLREDNSKCDIQLSHDTWKLTRDLLRSFIQFFLSCLLLFLLRMKTF